MKKILLLLNLFLVTLISVSQTYQNPISLPYQGPIGIGDPSTFRWMGKYYMLASKNPAEPGLSMWQSEDLVNWTYIGACSTDAAIGDAWAPEVFYFNGTFYMYSSHPDQNIRALRYDLPLNENAKLPIGPYTCFSNDFTPGVSNEIDPSPFRDDNGQLYLFFAGGGGIKYRTMSTPENCNGATQQITSCKVSSVGPVSSTWTEGATVIKKNGTYYMTYCGNDVCQPSYQVHAGKGTTISGITKQTNNPVIAKYTGDWTGSGHNHLVLGPDMKTYYTTYHCKRDQAPCGVLYRRLFLDKVDFDSSNRLIVTGPTTTPQNSPALPTWSDDFNRTEIGSDWTFADVNSGSAWGLWGNLLMWSNSRGQGAPSWWSKAICNKVTADNFVAEFNLKLMAAGSDSVNFWPKFGVFVCQQSSGADNMNNLMYIALSTKDNKIATLINQNGVGGWQNDAVTIPAPCDLTKWHVIRVEKQATIVKIFFDNMLLLTKTNVTLPGGHFGFITENTHADFGWVGFSNY